MRRGRRDAAWLAALTGAALLAGQTALVGTGALTARFALALIVTSGAALLARAGRSDREPAPDPVALVLAGLAGLGLFAVAWWAMDLADHLLRQTAGLLPLPALLSRDADRLLGLELRPISYETAVLSAVVLIPLAQSWLLWGALRQDCVARAGLARGAWAAGIAGGCVLALSAPQQVEPALPYGLAALPGYALVGSAAAWASALSRSFWAGFAVQGVFAYASLALRDDLLRAVSGKSYVDLAWLSLIVLGVFGAGVALQVIRVRAETAPGGTLAASPARPARPRAALALLLAAVIALAAIDLLRRG